MPEAFVMPSKFVAQASSLSCWNYPSQLIVIMCTLLTEATFNIFVTSFTNQIPVLVICDGIDLFSTCWRWASCIPVLGHQATSRSQARAKELAELRLQVLVVVITSDACESKKEVVRLKSDLQSVGPQGVLLVLICPMTTPRLSWSCHWTIPRTYLSLLY